MAEEQEAIPGPDIGDPKSRRRRALDHVNRIRSQHRWIDHLAAAVELYHHDRIEYYALKVVSRGLFLAVSVMLVFLYVFDLTTNLIPGINEIAIPTMSLPDEQDLGQVVHLTLQHSRGALMDVVGFGTLLVSAVLTAKALRRGTAQVLQSEDADRVHTFQLRNLVIGLGLALVVLASWLLVFVTAIRSAAIRTVLGPGITSAQVNVGKAAVIALTWVLLTAVVFLPLRRFCRGRPAGTVLLASAVFGAFVVAINFVLLYSYIAALFDPDSSSGVVLVLTLLAWVNLAARGLFLTQSWILESGQSAKPYSGVASQVG